MSESNVKTINKSELFLCELSGFHYSIVMLNTIGIRSGGQLRRTLGSCRLCSRCSKRAIERAQALTFVRRFDVWCECERVRHESEIRSIILKKIGINEKENQEKKKKATKRQPLNKI